MTKDLKKLEKAIMEYINNFEKIDDNMTVKTLKRSKIWKALKKVARPKPSKEETIDVFSRYISYIKECGLDARVGFFMNMEDHEKYFNHVIELLKNHKIKWIKNTGIAPKCKKVIYKCKDNGNLLFEDKVINLDWQKNNLDTDIAEYIIIK